MNKSKEAIGHGTMFIYINLNLIYTYICFTAVVAIALRQFRQQSRHSNELVFRSVLDLSHNFTGR